MDLLYNNSFVSGEIRECFSTSFKLGRRNNPVKVTPRCELQRTQSDPGSSIRACICTSDYCNDDLFSGNNNQPSTNGGNNTNVLTAANSSLLLCDSIVESSQVMGLLRTDILVLLCPHFPTF